MEFDIWYYDGSWLVVVGGMIAPQGGEVRNVLPVIKSWPKQSKNNVHRVVCCCGCEGSASYHGGPVLCHVACHIILAGGHRWCAVVVKGVRHLIMHGGTVSCCVWRAKSSGLVVIIDGYRAVVKRTQTYIHT